MVLVSVLLSVLSHVPIYGQGKDKCFAILHHHTTSQAIYTKGSGGLEVSFSSPSYPFDMLGGEMVDIDAVFKREYDQSTFDLFVGCGGTNSSLEPRTSVQLCTRSLCVLPRFAFCAILSGNVPLLRAGCVFSVDPVVISPMRLDGYQQGELEPFSQSWYFSVFPKSERKFNSSDLLHCDEGHFGIFVKDYHNRSNGEELVWSPVIGLGERFTLTEILSFPTFAVQNHGDAWNGLGWSVWINFIFFAPITLWVVRMLFGQCGVYVPRLDIQWTIDKGRASITGSFALREIFYEIALIGFVGTMLEQLCHLMYAQSFVPVNRMLYVGLVYVVFLPNGLGIALVLTFWSNIDLPDGPMFGEACTRRCTRCTLSNRWWAPVEILSGFGFFFALGAGFYLGPAAVMLAGITRLLELHYTLSSRIVKGATEDVTFVSSYPLFSMSTSR